jgi:hypothetical protein
LVLGVLAALIAFGLLAALVAQRAAPSVRSSSAATKQQQVLASAAATRLGGGSRRSLQQFTSLLALGTIGNNLAAGKYDDAIAAALNKSGAAVPPPVTAAAAAAAPAAEDVPQYKIVGGAPASPGRWPWVCSVRSSKSDAHFCGCSLVAPRLVVTAAHCLDQTRADLALPNIDIGRCAVCCVLFGVLFALSMCVRVRWL